uniref:Uncharacterized protein n=1 Tax=Anguilla anguilla TaxID=7936 RepID=A0A0E9SJH5_ANGAN
MRKAHPGSIHIANPCSHCSRGTKCLTLQLHACRMGDDIRHTSMLIQGLTG